MLRDRETDPNALPVPRPAASLFTCTARFPEITDSLQIVQGLRWRERGLYSFCTPTLRRAATRREKGAGLGQRCDGAQGHRLHTTCARGTIECCLNPLAVL